MHVGNVERGNLLWGFEACESTVMVELRDQFWLKFHVWVRHANEWEIACVIRLELEAGF